MKIYLCKREGNVTEFINHEKFITNSQIEEVINLLGEEYKPRHIIVFENRFQCLKYNLKNIFKIREFNFTVISDMKGDCEVTYIPTTDTIKIFVYAAEGDTENMQVSILYDLIVNLRSRHQFNDELKKEDTYFNANYIFELSDIKYTLDLLITEEYQTLIHNFVAEFMSTNTENLAEIMDWEYEWDFEENSVGEDKYIE